ncbi:MAG: hypothetical protein ACLUKQ_01085 [Peptococcaceae bacterium]
MKLHEDKFAFLNIISLIHEDSSIRADILEKDYYVTLLLRELAAKQVSLPAYFKDGTACIKPRKGRMNDPTFKVGFHICPIRAYY